MTCYVDQPIFPFGRMMMCHLWADTLDELLAMVDRIGVDRKWIQGHPDLSFGKHRNASWMHFDIARESAPSRSRPVRSRPTATAPATSTLSSAAARRWSRTSRRSAPRPGSRSTASSGLPRRRAGGQHEPPCLRRGQVGQRPLSGSADYARSPLPVQESHR